MAYKYQGFGAGPTTRGQMIGLTITLVVLIAGYVALCVYIIGR